MLPEFLPEFGPEFPFGAPPDGRPLPDGLCGDGLYDNALRGTGGQSARPRPLVSLLPPPRVPPPSSPYAEPRVYGLRFCVRGDLSAGSLVKVTHAGRWRHIVFHGRVSAVQWLNVRYCRQWPEFIEVERLRAEQLDALDRPVFPEELTHGYE